MEENCSHILTHPFDVAKISAKRKQIKRSLLSQTATTPLRVAVLGGSTTSELVSILELFLLRESFAPVFHESEYGRFYEDAVVDNKASGSSSLMLRLSTPPHGNIRHFPEAAEKQARVEDDFREQP